MNKFFEYNWAVRDEWFKWCNHLSTQELLKQRSGGVGGILYTLFHITDVEYSWIRGIKGKEDVVFQFADYNTFEKVKSLSDNLRSELALFLIKGLDGLKDSIVRIPWDEEEYAVDEILHHIIAHEIHHIGQLSIWSRELEKQPISANFIGGAFKLIHSYRANGCDV
ncbi:DinB family protein [Lederbergia citrisecunda]|uniref:DinB family protein n=1 Tax=Lederbergia citrisecunda TaxID=2833583 RepID=UPI003D27C71C